MKFENPWSRPSPSPVASQRGFRVQNHLDPFENFTQNVILWVGIWPGLQDQTLPLLQDLVFTSQLRNEKSRTIAPLKKVKFSVCPDSRASAPHGVLQNLQLAVWRIVNFGMEKIHSEIKVMQSCADKMDYLLQSVICQDPIDVSFILSFKENILRDLNNRRRML